MARDCMGHISDAFMVVFDVRGFNGRVALLLSLARQADVPAIAVSVANVAVLGRQVYCCAELIPSLFSDQNTDHYTAITLVAG